MQITRMRSNLPKLIDLDGPDPEIELAPNDAPRVRRGRAEPATLHARCFDPPPTPGRSTVWSPHGYVAAPRREPRVRRPRPTPKLENLGSVPFDIYDQTTGARLARVCMQTASQAALAAVKWALQQGFAVDDVYVREAIA